VLKGAQTATVGSNQSTAYFYHSKSFTDKGGFASAQPFVVLKQNSQ